MRGKGKWILIGVLALIATMAFIPKVREAISDLINKIKGQ